MKRIWVSDDFERMLKESWEEFNRRFEKRVKRKISFVDFTGLIAESLKNYADVVVLRGLIVPIKKGRKRAKARFRPEDFLW